MMKLRLETITNLKISTFKEIKTSLPRKYDYSQSATAQVDAALKVQKEQSVLNKRDAIVKFHSAEKYQDTQKT